jgi:hypothetical protein
MDQDLRKDHFERWILQLLDEAVLQQAMLELKASATSLGCQMLELEPNQEGAADVMALNPSLTALAAFQPCHLLAF